MDKKKTVGIICLLLFTLIAIMVLIITPSKEKKLDDKIPIKEIVSNKDYILKQVNSKKFKLKEGESYTYHDGHNGIVYLMKLNITNGAYFYTDAIYKYDYIKDELDIIKEFDSYTRIFDMKSKNKDELYYTKVDYNSNDGFLTYYVVKLKKGVEEILDSGKILDVLRTPSLEMVHNDIYYLKENIDLDMERYTTELKNLSVKKQYWMNTGVLKNYLVRDSDENLDNPYISASDNSLSFFTSTKDKSYFYQMNQGIIKKQKFDIPLYDTIVTENYDLLEFENSIQIIEKSTSKMNDYHKKYTFNRHCYIEKDVFAGLDSEKVVIHSIINGKLKSYVVEEIPSAIDISLVRIDKKKVMIIVNTNDEDNLMYILELKE